ncbi:MAG: hypothetical protein K2N95_13940 [Lachnospiraceae bacterium]|nr:hypothetical protein [Lachnospiraceae bacterium]
MDDIRNDFPFARQWYCNLHRDCLKDTGNSCLSKRNLNRAATSWLLMYSSLWGGAWFTLGFDMFSAVS